MATFKAFPVEQVCLLSFLYSQVGVIILTELLVPLCFLRGTEAPAGWYIVSSEAHAHETPEGAVCPVFFYLRAGAAIVYGRKWNSAFMNVILK